MPITRHPLEMYEVQHDSREKRVEKRFNEKRESYRYQCPHGHLDMSVAPEESFRKWNYSPSWRKQENLDVEFCGKLIARTGCTCQWDHGESELVRIVVGDYAT